MNNEKNPNLFFFRLCPGIGSSGKNRNAPTNANAAKDSQKSAFPTSSLTELNRIREICSRVLLIRAGRLEADGGSDEVVDLYLRSEGGLAD